VRQIRTVRPVVSPDQDVGVGYLSSHSLSPASTAQVAGIFPRLSCRFNEFDHKRCGTCCRQSSGIVGQGVHRPVPVLVSRQLRARLRQPFSLTIHGPLVSQRREESS
jgi:hypothetical protein